MIIPKDIKPEKSLYAIGAILVRILSESDAVRFNVDDLYSRLVLEYRESISFGFYLYALDWLFLAGAITQGNKPFEIKKCI